MYSCSFNSRPRKQCGYKTKYSGLKLIGLVGICQYKKHLLLLGLFSRYTTLIGMGLVILYYLFAPPLLGLEYSRPGEGSYIIVNKNLIEACALWVIHSFPTSHVIGLDRLLFNPESN